MKIEHHGEQLTFDEFCERHNIDLVAHERPKHYNLAPWYVTASKVEIREGGCLTSTFGNGDTPEEAKEAYAARLAGHRLLIGGYKGTEVTAPNKWKQ